MLEVQFPEAFLLVFGYGLGLAGLLLQALLDLQSCKILVFVFAGRYRTHGHL